MTHNRLILLLGLALTAGFTYARFAHAEAPLAEKATDAAKETAKDVKKGTQKMARAASDAGCTMVKGKMECAAQKAKHKVQNAADDVTK